MSMTCTSAQKGYRAGSLYRELGYTDGAAMLTDFQERRKAKSIDEVIDDLEKELAERTGFSTTEREINP